MSTQDTMIGRRAEAHREELRYAAFNLARTVGLAQHIVTEIEADEPGPLNNTGTLYAVLETADTIQATDIDREGGHFIVDVMLADSDDWRTAYCLIDSDGEVRPLTAIEGGRR
jgi:DNA-binding XRE family transcriptional regulator